MGASLLNRIAAAVKQGQRLAGQARHHGGIAGPYFQVAASVQDAGMQQWRQLAGSGCRIQPQPALAPLAALEPVRGKCSRQPRAQLRGRLVAAPAERSAEVVIFSGQDARPLVLRLACELRL